LGELPGQITNATEALIKDPVSAIQALFSGTGRFFGVLGSVIGITISVVVFVVLVPIYFVFFAWRFPAIVAWVSRFVPSKRKTRIAAMANRTQEIFAAFFRARLLICLIMAALFAFGWTFVGVPYAFLLGVVTGFLCLVPFASVIGWPLAVLLKYLEATAVPPGLRLDSNSRLAQRGLSRGAVHRGVGFDAARPSWLDELKRYHHTDCGVYWRRGRRSDRLHSGYSGRVLIKNDF
jgi:uncharacterized membrane protein